MTTGFTLFSKYNSLATPEEYISHLESILFLMPGHVYWIDKNNIYLGCNESQAKSFGLNTSKEVIGKNNYDLMPNKKEAEHINEINLKVMKSGIARTLEEKVVLAGTERVYLSEKVPLYNQNNEIIGLLGISFDITHRKQMEQDLKESKRKSEIANQAKDEFIRNLEHDIRTPISGLIGISNFLKSSELDFNKKKMLEDVENSSRELMKYFTDVLEFCYIEEGENSVILRKMDLKELVQNVYNLELPAAQNKKLEFVLNYSDDVPYNLIGDKFRIQRILINLISNAIKFTEKGYVKLSVTVARKIGKQKVLLLFIIEDTGMGIPEQKQNILFEKFYKASPSNQGRYKGTGLGLRIVKKLIKDLKGEVEVQSTFNQGTKFICAIPFKLPLLLGT